MSKTFGYQRTREKSFSALFTFIFNPFVPTKHWLNIYNASYKNANNHNNRGMQRIKSNFMTYLI